MMNKILWLVIVSSFLLYPKEIVLTGKVFDHQTGYPVRNAVIFISGNYYYSNTDGAYRIGSLQPGVYSTRISHLSYKTILQELVISSDSFQQKDFFLESSFVNLDEVIVTSKRRENYLKYSSDSELLFSKDQIQVKPFQSLSDALQNEAGISLLRDGMWGTDISIRGLSRQNIVTLIDGSRIETSTDIAARLSMFNLEDIERVEIIKGASSSIYGSGATGGIINIISRTPEFREKLYFSGNISSGFNSVNNLSAVSTSLFSGSSFWNSKLSASFRRADDVQTPSGTLKNSRFKDYSITASSNVIPSEDHLLKMNYQLFKAEDVGIPGGSPLFPDIADVRYPVEKREMISAGYEIKNVSRLIKKVSIFMSHQYILREVENIPYSSQIIPSIDNQPAKKISVLKITPGAEHNINSLQLLSELFISESNYLTLGLDLWIRRYKGEREKYQLIEMLNANGNVITSFEKVIGEKPLPNSSFQSVGIFLRDEYELLAKKLFLSLGARADGIKIKADKTYNPEYEVIDGSINYTPSNQALIWNETEYNDISYSLDFGVLYSAFKDLDLSISLGYSFRSPSLEERFQFIDLGSLIRLGNPALKPERGRFADLGIRYYGNNIKVISSFFYNNLTDLVTEEPAIYDHKQARVKTSAGKAHLYGFDISISSIIYQNLFAHASASFVKGMNLKTKKYLPEIPPLNSHSGVRYRLSNIFEAELSSTIFSEQKNPAPFEFKTPGYVLFNFSLAKPGVSFGSVVINFYSGIENIFNKSYRNHLSTARGSITAAPGRNIYFKVAAEW